MINEVWAEIEDYDNYMISTLGRVKSCLSGKIMKQRLDQKGYPFLGLTKNKKRATFRVHRLVAKAFLDDPENDKMVVDHINRCKIDNNVNNLRWVTIKQNQENMGKMKHKAGKATSSRYKGVIWNKQQSKWQAKIFSNGKGKHLGFYANEKNAMQMLSTSILLKPI